MQTTLLRNGSVHTPTGTAQALLYGAGVIRWVGPQQAAPAAHREIDLRGAWVAPAFVDAHVHHTEAGLTLVGLDLRGTASARELLEVVARAALTGPVVGHGWDESNWVDAGVPDRAALDRAVGDTAVYLSRVDVHSGLVSSALVRANPELRDQPGYSPSGALTGAAHTTVRRYLATRMPGDLRTRAVRAVRAHAAARGVAAVHEAAGPAISGAGDLRALTEICASEPGPFLVAYWGSTDLAEVAALGARGAAGDLCVDGALGSRTALLREPYGDSPGTSGREYLGPDEVAAHLVACTRAGIQGGFHAIGDLALDHVVVGLRVAVAECGLPAVRAARHRVEHACLCRPEHAAALARAGVVASVQPQFDTHWGGPAGMYEQRLGHSRASTVHDFAMLDRAGVMLALGADSPVTPIDPWAGVRGAVAPHNPAHRLDAHRAFDAATRGGWRAAGDDLTGPLKPGAPATFAIWSVPDWAGELPRLDRDTPSPQCLATVVAGQVIHGSDWLG